MELDVFIKHTLVSIKRGIREANAELATLEGKTLGQDGQALFAMEGFGRDRKEGYIHFDVAVTVSHEDKKSGGGGVKIAVVNIAGGKDNTVSQEHVSRIQFHILPYSVIC